MSEPKNLKSKCRVCGAKYADNRYGKFGKGTWNTCSPWCGYYGVRGMV